MPSDSPSAELYDDDEFDSPTASEYGDRHDDRSLSLPVMSESPDGSRYHSEHSDQEYGDEPYDDGDHGGGDHSLSKSKISRLSHRSRVRKDSPLPEDGKATYSPYHRLDSRLSISQDDDNNNLAKPSYSRQDTFVSRNDSRLSRHTYNADDANYEDDFDNEDFHSNGSMTPDHGTPVLDNDYPPIPESPNHNSHYNPQKVGSQSTLADVTNKTNSGHTGSTLLVRKLQNGSKSSLSKSIYNDSFRHLGSRNNTNLSCMYLNYFLF